jgi:hypothetical protein
MSKNILFVCQDCGGKVRLLPGAGEKREFKKGFVERIPASVLIPKCDGCGEIYFGPQDAKRVDAVLRKARMLKQSEEVSHLLRLLAAKGYSNGKIETACGVTKTYLSHVAAGRKLASAPLMRLLDAFGMSDAVLRKHAGSSNETMRGSLQMQPIWRGVELGVNTGGENAA